MRVDEINVRKGDRAGNSGGAVLGHRAGGHGGGHGRRVVGAGQRDRHVLRRGRAEPVDERQRVDLRGDLPGGELLHARVVGGEAPVDRALVVLVRRIFDDVRGQRAEAAGGCEAGGRGTGHRDACGTDRDGVRVGQVDVAEGDRAAARERRRGILDDGTGVGARNDRRAIVVAGDRHRDGRRRSVAITIRDGVGEGVDRLLAGSQILIIGRVGRVDDAGDRVGRIGVILGQHDGAVRGGADADRTDQVRDRIVREQIEGERGVVLGRRDCVGTGEHRLVTRIERQSVDDDLELLDAPHRQVEHAEIERALILAGAEDHADLVVDRGRFGVEEGDITRHVGLHVRAEPLVTGQDQAEGIDVLAAVVDVGVVEDRFGRGAMFRHAEREHVVAVATLDPIVARTAFDIIVAIVAVDPVVASTAANHVVAVVAVQMVIARAAVDDVVAVVTVDIVIACAADQRVVAVSAINDVVAITAIDPIVTVARMHQIVAGTGGDRVVAAAAVDVVGLGGPVENLVRGRGRIGHLSVSRISMASAEMDKQEYRPA